MLNLFGTQGQSYHRHETGLKKNVLKKGKTVRQLEKTAWVQDF